MRKTITARQTSVTECRGRFVREMREVAGPWEPSACITLIKFASDSLNAGFFFFRKTRCFTEMKYAYNRIQAGPEFSDINMSHHDYCGDAVLGSNYLRRLIFFGAPSGGVQEMKLWSKIFVLLPDHGTNLRLLLADDNLRPPHGAVPVGRISRIRKRPLSAFLSFWRERALGDLHLLFCGVVTLRRTRCELSSQIGAYFGCFRAVPASFTPKLGPLIVAPPLEARYSFLKHFLIFNEHAGTFGMGLHRHRPNSILRP